VAQATLNREDAQNDAFIVQACIGSTSLCFITVAIGAEEGKKYINDDANLLDCTCTHPA